MSPRGTAPPESKSYYSKSEQFNGKFAEFQGWDGFIDADVDGPPQGDVTQAAFAERLRKQSKDIAYIVAYNLHKATPGAWRRVAKREAGNLESYGIQADRIKIIFGGASKAKKNDEDYPDQTKVQLWILPADSPPPLKTVKTEPSPRKSSADRFIP
jgi:hypothetical protein